MENSINFFICGIRFRWIFADTRMAQYFQTVMCPQTTEGNMEGPVYTIKISDIGKEDSVVNTASLATVKTKKSLCYLEESCARAYIHTERIREAEALYYFLINPLLTHALALYGKLHFHGACFAAGGKGIGVLGPRNSGKTTLSVQALLAGYPLLTDDCFFVNFEMEAHSFYRPLHLHPDLFRMLQIDHRMEYCEPYMEDEISRNYRIGQFHPGQERRRQSLDLILFPTVAPAKRTAFHRMDNEEDIRKELYTNTEYGDDTTLTATTLSVLNRVCKLPVFKVYLGEDLFLADGLRIFLEQLLSEVG